ncbi:MAG: hypothetical protein H6968_02150 [Chromatiaceae bacterium]|nr:hypothetical protein [Chromatiaceae bacterium]MCP5441820.1 hypothetical protein [Chromatiaceae bacterium]
MTKIKMLAAAVAVASVSTLASANPPDAPTVYATGPMSPAVNSTNLSAQERAAFALLEGILQSVEGKIHAAGCVALTLPLKVYSDALTDPVVGNAKLGTAPADMTLVATGVAPTFRGQIINVAQNPAAGYVGNTPVSDYASNMVFNSANNMMVGAMTQVNVMSINWVPNQFTGYVIKDFYMGTTAGGDAHIVYDWGLQSLSKEGYPVEKYWQRSKTRRSDGGNGQTAFVKDRLVGVVPCRIAISLSGLNQFGIFQQTGTVSIQPAPVLPGTPATEITTIPNV